MESANEIQPAPICLIRLHSPDPEVRSMQNIENC